MDSEMRMVGIVTFDDAMDVIEEETTEDIEIMAGMVPSEKPYLRSSPCLWVREETPAHRLRLR